MDDSLFGQIDFGSLDVYLKNDDVTDISYTNNGQLWIKTLSKGIYREENKDITNALMEKIAFQCSNSANPFLDAEGSEIRLNFVHDSVAKNGIACVIRKTPAKIRLQKEKILADNYITLDVHEFLMKAIQGHCNVIVCGETGSGKTEFVKYLASKIRENEKIITVEDTLELHLDKIYPTRDIVAMKTNNIASYSDVLVACMRQNPRWILLSEVRSAEAVTAVRNSISSGHNILSTIHSDKASSIPMRLYSLLESSQDIDQFVKSMHRYIQLGIHVKGFYSKKYERFQREITQVCEFYVDDEENMAKSNIIYQRDLAGNESYNNPTSHLIDYLASQGVVMREDPFIPKGEAISEVTKEDNTKEATPAIENAPQVTNTVETQTQQVVTSNPPQANVAAGVSANAQNNNELEIVEM